MKCPECQVELRITRSRNIVEYDEEKKEPHLFIDQELSCLNKQCKNFEKVVQTVRNEQQIG